MNLKSICLFLTLIVGFSACSEQESPSHDYPIVPVDFNRVDIQKGFWYSRIKTASQVTIPYAFQKCEETGRVDNFIFAAGIREGKFRGRFGFDDSDVYKIIEGASYSLMLEPDPGMESYLDTLIRYISGAQEEDGYLYTPWTLKANDYNHFACCSYSEEGRFTGTSGASHEFYNAGHMYEAAVAHYLATGKNSFLDVAIKNADLIYDVCISQGHNYVPGHQEIEIGLVKLYRVTADQKYLQLAKHLLDTRSNSGGSNYSQAHMPVTQQKEAVGHAVRANYMYTAMADIAALTGDSAYLEAVDNLWDNVVSKKLSITGGVGASPHGESYGENYDLPLQPYNETCAAIANVYWNHRMFLLHGDAGYIDVLERSLYNGVLSGLSLEGNLFFYPNTMRHDGETNFNRGHSGRAPWFDCSCCPSNLSRFVPSVGAYAYAVRANDVFLNLYMNSRVDLELDKGTIGLSQFSSYPWKGNIQIEITSEKKVEASLYLRIPGWLRNQPVPSDLYSYVSPQETKPQITVNGKSVELEIVKGYAVLQGTWEKGDLLELEFPVEVKQARSHNSVEAKAGLVAFECGPIVYCAEGIDNDGNVLDLSFSGHPPMSVSYDSDLLNGINVLSVNATSTDAGKKLTRKVRLIPYYAWNHRGPGEMNVWFNQ